MVSSPITIDIAVRPALPDKLESAGELKVSPQKLVAGQEANFSIGAVEIDPELAELGAEVVYNWKIGPETKTTDTSTEKYSFEEPGEYTVELTAILKLDEETIVSDVVSVTVIVESCLLYTYPRQRDATQARMPS